MSALRTPILVGDVLFWTNNDFASLIGSCPFCGAQYEFPMREGEKDRLLSRDPLTIKGAMTCHRACGARFSITDGKFIRAEATS